MMSSIRRPGLIATSAGGNRGGGGGGGGSRGGGGLYINCCQISHYTFHFSTRTITYVLLCCPYSLFMCVSRLSLFYIRCCKYSNSVVCFVFNFIHQAKHRFYRSCNPQCNYWLIDWLLFSVEWSAAYMMRKRFTYITVGRLTYSLQINPLYVWEMNLFNII
jgi:hypothetical protein